jgi:gliding motility-associated-like protein
MGCVYIAQGLVPMKIYSTVVCMLVCAIAHAQLSNGSFELISSMPNGLGQWQRATGWSNAGSASSTPDLLHYDAVNACDLPETSAGFVDSFDGDAVMGMAICGRAGENEREYISTQLSAPMVVGKPYAIGFRMTNGQHGSTSQAGLAVDDIGFYFSVEQVTQNGSSPIERLPQLKIESVVYSAEWQTYIFTFYPQEPYRYLTFGLFGDDSDKNIQVLRGSNPSIAYYFVDYFTVEPLFGDYAEVDGEREPIADNVPTSGEREFFIPNTFTPNSDGNNDRFLPVAASDGEWMIDIFSSWGDRLYTSNQFTSGWDGTFQSLACSPGGYVWQITYFEESPNGKPKRHELRGMVHLVR